MSHPWTRHPASASALRSAAVVRSLATKPGMTRAGGPFGGPTGRIEPKARHIRGNSHAASRRRRRSDGGRSSPCQSTLEEFPPHQLLDSPGQLDPPVGRLVVLEQGYEDPGAGERRIVERVREPHLAVAAAVAEG